MKKYLIDRTSDFYRKSQGEGNWVRKFDGQRLRSLSSSAKEVMFSPMSVCLSVCLFVNRITQKSTDHIFMEFYEMVVHNHGTSRLD